MFWTIGTSDLGSFAHDQRSPVPGCSQPSCVFLVTAGLTGPVAGPPRPLPGLCERPGRAETAAPRRLDRHRRNIDWPSRPGLPPSSKRRSWWRCSTRPSTADSTRSSSRCGRRPTRSSPRARAVVAVPHRHAGPGPGYDPLAFAVEEAHARGLELHAWFNPYRVAMDTDRDALVGDQPGAAAPDWASSTAASSTTTRASRSPGARRGAVMDVVKRYDVDGVHIDDYFYPYPDAGTAVPRRRDLRPVPRRFPPSKAASGGATTPTC